MARACGGEVVVGDGPDAGVWIVHFGAGQLVMVFVYAANDKDVSILEERRSMGSPCVVETAGGGPDAGGGIVQFGAGRGRGRATAGDEDSSIAEKGGGVVEARSGEKTGVGPDAGGGVVQFGAFPAAKAVTRDENASILEEGGGVVNATVDEVAGGSPGVRSGRCLRILRQRLALNGDYADQQGSNQEQ